MIGDIVQISAPRWAQWIVIISILVTAITVLLRGARGILRPVERVAAPWVVEQLKPELDAIKDILDAHGESIEEIRGEVAYNSGHSLKDNQRAITEKVDKVVADVAAIRDQIR